MTRDRAIQRAQRRLAARIRSAATLPDILARTILLRMFGRALVLTTRVPQRRRV